MKYKFQELSLQGAFLIDPFSTGDIRGGFIKYFEQIEYEKMGLKIKIDESFASTSAKNVIRGLHFQLNQPQAKLVSVLYGKVWDVIVDLRPQSLTYKQWMSVELSAENHKVLYIPRGFAHGFASLEDQTTMLYMCDGKYDKETDTGIRFDDKEIGVEWQVKESERIYSKRDKGLMSFSEYHMNPMKV